MRGVPDFNGKFGNPCCVLEAGTWSYRGVGRVAASEYPKTRPRLPIWRWDMTNALRPGGATGAD